MSTYTRGLHRAQSRGFISLALILAIVIGVAVLGGAGWYATRHPSSTAPLTTSNNLSNNILESTVYVTPEGAETLRPPKGWAAQVAADIKFDHKVIVLFSPPDATSNSDSFQTPFLQLSMYVGGNALPLDYYVQATTEQHGEKEVSRKNITIEGIPGYEIETKITNSGEPTYHGKYVILANGAQVYLLAAFAKEAEWGTYGPLFDAVFATLKIQRP